MNRFSFVQAKDTENNLLSLARFARLAYSVG